MPADFDLEPNAPPADTPPADAPPAEPTVAELTAKLKEEEAQRRQAELVSQRNAEAYNNLMLAMATSNNQPTAPADPAPAATSPDPEEDLGGYIKHTVQEAVGSVVKQEIEPLRGQYTQDRQTVIANAVRQNRADASAKFPDFDKYAEEIDQMARQYGDMMSNPGAYDELYYRVVGVHSAKERAENLAKEQASLESAGRGTLPRDPGDRSDREPAFTDKQAKVAAAFGIDDPKEFEKFRGPGTVTIEEWQAHKASKKKGAAA
jgi:hypothetical protein